jgi:hypothetical protein
MADDDDLMESRSGASNPFGKCTEQAKTMLPFAIKEGLARLVHESGYGSEQEFLRDLITVNVVGVDGMLKIHEERMRRFVTIGAGKGTEQ